MHLIMAVKIVNVSEEHWQYVSLCSHIEEGGTEFKHAAAMRRTWLERITREGNITIKVAVDEKGQPLGFVHLVPIESPISAMMGEDLWVIPCLTKDFRRVYQNIHGSGIGRTLIHASEKWVKQVGGKGLAVYAYSGDMWFMPAAFFQKVGFTCVSPVSNIWVKKWANVKDPRPLVKKYDYRPIDGKIVIDYFWSPFCLTSCEEVLNVREVASEFRGQVVLREYRSDNADMVKRVGLIRALFINGKQVNWGYAVPKEELRKQLSELLADA
jgi:GNAT superfamily N-acetyltransferase